MTLIFRLVLLAEVLRIMNSPSGSIRAERDVSATFLCINTETPL